MSAGAFQASAARRRHCGAAGTLSAAILAGGQSRRMGRDKALLPVQGEPLLWRTARIAAECGLPVLVVGRAAETAGDHARAPAVRFVPDAVKGIGPLGGLLGALLHAGTDVLALACDLPRLTPVALRWLLDAAAKPLLHGLVACREGRPEPLFAIYTAACVPLIEQQISTGSHSLQALIRAGHFALHEVPRELSGCLHNVNTPEDLQQQ